MNTLEEDLNTLKVKKIVIWGLVGFISFIVLMGSFYTVNEGNVGIVKRLGKAVEQTNPGFHLKMPFIDEIVEMEVRTRKNTEVMPGSTSEQMPTTIKASVNWTVNKSAAIELYKQYGGLDQFENRILDPRFRSATKAGVAKFKAEQLIRTRGLAIAAIEELLKEETKGLPIELGDVQLENIGLPTKYLKSIETKQTELNLAAAETHKLARQELESRRSVNTANADRDSLKARADGKAYKIEKEAKAEAYAIREKGEAEAKAIKAKAKAISSNATLVEYVRAQNWNGQMPTTIMGGGQSILWSMNK